MSQIKALTLKKSTPATFKSDKAPEKADYLAQMNQQGSGTLEHKAAPKTTEVAPFQDNQVKKAGRRLRRSRPGAKAPKAAVTTTRQRQQKAPSKTQAQKAEQVARRRRISTQPIMEIASLADLHEAAHENAKAFHDKCENSSVSSYGAG
ncbi:hypothetical protein P4123_20775 [Pseudomonas aeruginosa]|nr:hypothetical protein [Pseudomonas aeruginosa]